MSFAIDAWASRLLFLGVANGGLRHFLENHRCSPRGHTFFNRWQLGPEFTLIEYQCSNCSQLQSMAVRTPFNLFGDPVAEYLYEGWPDLIWDSPIATWQLAHREHVAPSQAHFLVSRSFASGRVVFSLICPCGASSPPSAGWPLESTGRVEVRPDRPVTFPAEVTDVPKITKSSGANLERLVRHRASGRLYRLPAFTVHLEPVEGEAQSMNCTVENLWTEYDRFYGGDNSKFQTWHERIAKE